MVQPDRRKDSPRSEQESTIWTPEYGANLLFHTIKYSQGDPDYLEKHILRYLHALRPDWRINDKFLTEMTDRVTKRALSYVSPKEPELPEQPAGRWDGLLTAVGFKKKEPPSTQRRMHVNYAFKQVHKRNEFGGREIKVKPTQMTESIVRGQINDEAQAMQEIFNEPPGLPEYLIFPIFQHMIMRDTRLIPQGRPRVGIVDHDPNERSKNPMHDPRSSFLIDYGFRGASAGQRELEEMFLALKEFAKTHTDSANLPALISIYNDYHSHPNVRFDISELFSESADSQPQT